jgi:probable HAF family extracellular repeat protein
LHAVGTAINNSGVVVGTGSSAQEWHSTLWTPAGNLRDLGTLSHGTYSSAFGINDNNQVVGWSYLNESGSVYHGFFWSPTRPSALQDLGTLGGDQSIAFGVNLSGVICGYSQISSGGSTHAAMWADHNSTPVDIGTLPGGSNSYARVINASGQIAGYADVP